MRVLVFEGEVVARQAARIAADTMRTAIAMRGKAYVALSGGRTPWGMFRIMADEPLPWPQIEVFQVDERVVARGDPARTLTSLNNALLSRAPLMSDHIHAMPVEADDLETGAQRYAAEIAKAGGMFDLVHLGLGDDGHTASLVPGDPVLDVTDRDVALSGPYQGLKRMTLTYPVLNRAGVVLWLVTGSGKAEMLSRLIAGDHGIPAGRINSERAVIVADRDAARLLPSTKIER
jgi:6-phosphogluconolactonase